MVSFLKKAALAVFILFVTILLGRNWLFTHLFSYKTDSVISSQLIDNQPLAPKTMCVTGVDSLIRLALDETSAKLRFSFGNCSSDPVEIAKTGRANCIGYSAMFKNILEKKLAAAGCAGDFGIEHRRGRLHFLGTDLHRFSKNKFWKDHDFVAVRQVSTGGEWVIDPSLFDVFGVGIQKK